MRRLYITTLDVWKKHVDISIFHPGTGSHYVPLQDGLIVVSADFNSEGAEETWHAHPEVAILPNPVFEGTDQIKKHKGSDVKKLKQKHVDALAALGCDETNTVLDVAAKTAAIHPLCRIRPIF